MGTRNDCSKAFFRDVNTPVIRNTRLFIPGLLYVDLFSIGKKSKVNVNIFPIHSMKACKGNRGRTPYILNFGTRWR